jgi:hypothetical protein
LMSCFAATFFIYLLNDFEIIPFAHIIPGILWFLYSI